jgi:hypothetical protein
MAITAVRDKSKPRGPDGKYPIIKGLYDVVVWTKDASGRRHRVTRRVTGKPLSRS